MTDLRHARRGPLGLETAHESVDHVRRAEHHSRADALFRAAAGASWRLGQFALGADGIYSQGLRSGFADLEQLPQVVQVNFSVERSFVVGGGEQLTNRLTLLNAFDRVNLIRPANGIGIFQSAYAPRRTLYYTLSWRF